MSAAVDRREERLCNILEASISRRPMTMNSSSIHSDCKRGQRCPPYSERGAAMRRMLVATAVVAAALFLPGSRNTSAQRGAASAIPDLSGRILTVAGPIDPSQSGQTLMHEHIFIDFKPAPPMAPPPTGISVLSSTPPPAPAGGRGGGGLTDYDESLAEIVEFKKIGGGTIVDTTNFGLTRDPNALLR